MELGEALALLDTCLWLKVCGKSAVAHVRVRDELTGFHHHVRCAVRRKRSESLSALLIRLAVKARAARPPRPAHDRDSEIAASLGIAL